MSRLKIGVHGACGRMGRTIVEGVLADSDLELAAAIEHPGHPRLGEDIGLIVGSSAVGVAVGDSVPTHLDGIIDFSVPEASLAVARRAAELGTPLLVATTGFSPKQRDELISLHHTTPLLVASNCSLVVNLLNKLCALAGQVLRGRDFDVEIIERHHRFKADSPSGTALTLADTIAREMDLPNRCFGREGLLGPRPANEIGIHAVRVGDNVGEHTVIFSTLGETLELVHKGHNRQSYARGALAGIKFLCTRKPGLYSMADVLGL